MCGICGIVDLSGRLDVAGVVQSMTDSLIHRGPDDCGIRFFRSEDSPGAQTALGHRRLSVIDLSPSARQPMTGRTADTAVVFNGEIYNFREKRSELGAYPFRSRSDTEVILALYESCGDEFVRHLDGMFALALWDGRKRRLLLARDRVGKKPLYYYHAPSFFAFASEVKALRYALSLEVDPAALPLYLTFGYVPSPATFYRGVRKLDPGCVLEVDRHGAVSLRRYWEPPLPEAGAERRTSGQAERSGEALRRLFREAVRRRLVSDVPLGAFLSGGLDSSIVVGTMSSIASEPVRTFSVGFADDPAYDETSYARMVARRFGTRHIEFRVRPNALDLIEKLVWHYDEPFGDSSAIPTFLVSKLAREHVTVVLSGDGGDELFAGYERFAALLWSERVPREVFAAARTLARLLPAPGHAKSRRRRLKRFLEKAALPRWDRYLEWNSFFTRPELSKLLPGASLASVPESFQECLRRSASASLLRQVLHLNFLTYLLDDLLVKTDRTSMANGLEVRCPFLDTALIEWAACLPDELMIRGRTLKYILRRAFRHMLPPAILRREKMGFGVPLGHWMRHDLREYSRDLLLGPSSRTSDLLAPDSLRRILDEHDSGAEDHGQKIWLLLCLETWLRSRPTSSTTRRGCSPC